MDDVRKLREADRSFDDAPGLAALPAPPGTMVVVAQVVDDGNFPEQAQSVFTMKRMRALVHDEEGDEPDWDAFGAKFHAANIGNSLPEAGETVTLCYSTPGGFVFIY